MKHPPGGTPLYMAIWVCVAPSGRVFGRFGLKTDIHFAHFGLELGMGFEGTTECINVFIISIPNEKERKRNM